MTALCGGGSSGANPTAAAIVSVTLDFLGLATDTYEIEWLAQALNAAGPFTPFVLASFCTTDPPAMPTWTLAESTALQALDILSPDFATGIAKVPDWVANVVWANYCQCNSGTYTPAANPVTPTGTPIPTGPTGLATTTPCLLAVYDPHNNFVGTEMAAYAGSSYAGLVAVPAGGTSIQWVVLGDEFSGATRLSTSSHLVFYASDHTTVLGVSPTQSLVFTGSYVASYERAWWSGGVGGQVVPAAFKTLSSPEYQTALVTLGNTVTLPAGTAFIGCSFTSFANSGDTLTPYLAVYCGSTPGAPASSGCCPTDPALLSIVTATLKMATLLQRQLAPFAYVLGTAHSVSGTGTISVQGLLGLQVTLGTLTAQVGVESGTPDTLFGAGWINWGTADGYTAREYVADSPFLSMPAEAGQYTSIGYSFPPGLTATLTEVSREP